MSVNIFSGKPTLGFTTPISGQYISLPSTGLTFRRIFLPRASKAVRQQVITEELSYSLPFPLNEAHYGAVEMGDEAWVIIAADAVVQPITDLYPKANLEAEPLCYVRAAKAAGIHQALVVDLGAGKTVFCGVENGQVGTVRVLLRGGEALTEALAQEIDIPLEEAELLKHEEGAQHPVVRRFYQELVEEAFLPSPFPYRRVLLCGGGAATSGLLTLLGTLWGDDVDVEPFPLPGLLMPTEHVVAYGAALAGRPKAVRLKMEHSFQHAALSGGGPVALAPILFSVVLMALMTATLETRLMGAEQNATELRTTLDVALTPVIPNPQEIKEENIVKTLRDQLQIQRESARSSPARTMNTLGQCSSAVTAKKDATLFSIIYEDNKLKLEGRAQSLAQSEDIRTSIEKVLVDVQQVKTRQSSGNTIVFQVEGQLPEP